MFIAYIHHPSTSLLPACAFCACVARLYICLAVLLHACWLVFLQDLVFQYTRKSGAGTLKARQVVPGMHWEAVPSPVVEVRWMQLGLRDRLHQTCC
jgi:hypothetical protein